MAWEEMNEEANGLTQRGISLAAMGDFAEARADFEEAILLRESLDWEKLPLVAWGLAGGWINRADALAALGYLAEAALSYEQGARVLGGLDLSPGVCERAGILWSNHGLVMEKLKKKKSARASFCRAVTFFQSSGSCEFKNGLATARLHLSRVGEGDEILQEARSALDLVKNEEGILGLELNLKARHQICARLCEDLLTGKRKGGDWIAEVTDLVEEGLKLARDYESGEIQTGIGRQNIAQARVVALDLFRLGLRVYRVCQPQFFCEFLRESLDPQISVGAPSDDIRFLAVAVEALQEAMADQLDYEVIGLEEIEIRKANLQEMRALDFRLNELMKGT